jgi:hypothetical protein
MDPSEIISEFNRLADLAASLPVELGSASQKIFIVAINAAQDVVDSQWAPHQGFSVCYHRVDEICRARQRRINMLSAIHDAQTLETDARAASAMIYEVMRGFLR